MSNTISGEASNIAPKGTFLVLGDELEVRRVVQYCLEDLAGWDVTASSAGKEGLLLAMTQQFDAIVLDIVMPGMDELVFLRALRAYSSSPDPRIILLMSKSSVALDVLFDLNIVGVIEKPFDPVQLPIQVAELLNWKIAED